MNIEERKKRISELVKDIYCKRKHLGNQALDIWIDEALNKFLLTDLTMDEIKKQLEDMASKKAEGQYSVYYENKDDFNSDIKNNHEDIYDRLDELVFLLNENNIDYQLAGALCGYLKYGEESNRKHDDIDISVNEDDLGKVKEICQSLGFSFIDDRKKPRKKLIDGKPVGDQEVQAIDIRDGFRIDVLCFKRLENGDVVSKEYYLDEDDNVVCKEEIFEGDLAKLLYGKEEITFRDNKLFITPPEYVYSFKKYTDTPKDIEDVKYLDSRINMDKLREITELLSSKKININSDKENENTVSNDLESMMNDISDEKDNDISHENEKPKTFQFKRDEDGFADSLSITSLFVATSVIILIGLIALFIIVK